MMKVFLVLALGTLLECSCRLVTLRTSVLETSVDNDATVKDLVKIAGAKIAGEALEGNNNGLEFNDVFVGDNANREVAESSDVMSDDCDCSSDEEEAHMLRAMMGKLYKACVEAEHGDKSNCVFSDESSDDISEEEVTTIRSDDNYDDYYSGHGVPVQQTGALRNANKHFVPLDDGQQFASTQNDDVPVYGDGCDECTDSLTG